MSNAVTSPQPPPKALREDPVAAASRTSTICITLLVSLSLPNLSLDAERFRPGVDRSASRLSARVPRQRHLPQSGSLGGLLALYL